MKPVSPPRLEETSAVEMPAIAAGCMFEIISGGS